MLNVTAQVAEDFNEILEDIGESVTVERPTKTLSNVGLDESLSYATGVQVKGVFQFTDKRYLYDKEGIVELGDAVFYTFSNNSVAMDARVTRNNATYKVEKAIPRYGVDMCVLYLWSD